MNSLIFILVLIIHTVITENVIDNRTNTINEFYEESEGSRVLSRRKRFVIFPDGSSFQLVFLLQIPAMIPIGDIFLYATTAGLAWSLPADPKIFNALKDFEKPLKRSDVVRTINYLDEDGRLIAKVPYKRRLIVNPAFGKRSIEDNLITNKEELKPKIDRKKMHDKHLKTDHLKTQQLDKVSVEFHRSKRAELYQKIEKLLSAKPIVNPAFAKRSVDWPNKKGTLEKFKIDRKQMHASENKREYLNGRMAQRSVEYHRSSRASLYQKIETMLHGLGVNGKDCVLKTLCLVGQTQDHPQGEFFQELMRAVFTLPKNSVGVEDKHGEYDEALSATGSCDELYPECDETLLEPEAARFAY